MSANQSQQVLTSVDRVLADPKFLNEPRALLLLRICQMAQVFRPDVVQRYWEQLRNLSGTLPAEHRAAFEGLRAVIEPPPKSSLGKFAQEIVDATHAGVKAAESNQDEARRILRDCEERLRRRWWWPFGHSPAWIALVQAWADVDQAETLKMLGRVPYSVQQNILVRLNDRSPLSPEAWDVAQRVVGSITPILIEVLDRDKPELRLSAQLAKAVSRALITEVHLIVPGEDSSRQTEARREKGLQRYIKLVQCMNDVSPDLAESLMESLLAATATTPLHNEKWPDRFTAIRQLIGIWNEFPAHREKALVFLTNKIPSHLRDFALSQWYATIPTSYEEATNALQSLNQVCSDKVSSEAWFLVTLLRRGLADVVLALARLSPNSKELMPRIRRAWLLINPETASSAITPQDLEGDLIGQFLFLASIGERVEFLRRQTGDGKKSLPGEMWKQPDFMSIANVLSSDAEVSGDASQRALLSLYSKNEKPERQFRVYLRIHGYGQYIYDELDPHLLVTLVAWDQEHPDEVEVVLSNMWAVMKPPATTIRFDVLRNAIVERCQAVFAARPTSLDELFIKWAKRELVDNPIRWQEGNTVYTFSLKDIVPFLYCLLSAQKVGKLSAKRCDEILTRAISTYTASEDLMTAAAELFALDKGLSALQPPAALKNNAHLKAWQLGVVQASLQEIVASLLAEVQAGTAAMAAS